MAMPSNKSSSSSSPIATRPSPNSRNSEIANPVRRSFTGNPFSKPSIVANARSINPNSPANSPSENPRRSSMGRETVVTFRDLEDKENGKDSTWKQIRIRSPVGSKGAKNFMSPTISAASKITASPRKKILAERNEPVRTSSVSIADFKCVSFAPTLEDSEHKEVVSTTPLRSKPPKPLIDVDSMEPLSSKNECPESICENASEEPDCVNLDPSFKISPPASCPVSGRVIAPLDADPSAPPYDPKTNYLSPRPQFLHYRPNPRVEYYLSKDSEGKRLEESFISESFSDTETTEETQSDYSQKEVEDVTSSAEGVKQERQEEKKEDEVHVSEPTPINPSNTYMSKEEAVEVQESSKPRFLWRSKFTGLLMVLSVALFSFLAINSPLTDGFVLKDMSFLKEYDQSGMAELARASFHELARNVQVLSAHSVSFISEFISNIRGANNVGPLQYYNLTLMDDARGDEYSVFDQCNKEMEEMGEFDVFGHIMGSVFDIEASEEKGLPEIGVAEYEEPIDQVAEVPHIVRLEVEDQPEIEAADTVGEQVENIEALEESRSPVIGATENLVELHADPEFGKMAESNNMEEVSQANNGEVLQATQAITVENIVAEHESFEPRSTVSMEEKTLTSRADEVQIPEVEEIQADSEMSTVAEANSLVSSEVLNLTAKGADSMVSTVSVLGIAILVFALVGFTAFNYIKKRKNSAPNPASAFVQPLVTKKLAASPIVPDSTEHTYCPSEMSSFQTSSLYRTKGLEASDEAESQEKRARKNNRRESVASIDSSMGSPSYGSFTTYERIPIKKGYGEAEVVTPVRRSSRIIRKQVTSPY
ncbi:hypothetical protein M0R45_007446 [Rubus argutus]|uniref:SEA domain-containing protein n=1 Tax=Rubus argutus TaxID=59490 RepID=A0AAW1XZ72_RUBAR